MYICMRYGAWIVLLYGMIVFFGPQDLRPCAGILVPGTVYEDIISQATNFASQHCKPHNLEPGGVPNLYHH